MTENMDCGDVNNTFDISSYAQRYTGMTKVARLCFIADNMPACAGGAINLTVMELRNGINTDTYCAVFEKYGSVISHNDIRMDVDWVAETNSKAQDTLEKLQSELSAVKTAGVKESIRMSYNDIGHFLLKRGQFGEATKAFVKARDYCTQTRHMCELGMSCMRVCIDAGNVRGAMGYANKIEASVDIDSVTRAMKCVVTGLCHLNDSIYNMAAEGFLAVEEVKEVFPLMSEDVATYGALCAMATLPRSAVDAKILQSSKFKKHFENAQEMRQLVQSFIGNRFGECMALFNKLEMQFCADMYLAPHVSKLRVLIVERVVQCYCQPYDTVSMQAMAQAVGLPLAEIEKICTRLVFKKALEFRVDALRKLLYRMQGSGTGAKTGADICSVMAVADNHGDEMTRGILKCSVFQYGLVVKPTEQERKQLQLNRETEGFGDGGNMTIDDNYYDSPTEEGY